MDSHRWRRVREVFEIVVGLPDRERTARLAELCADDGGLRQAVEALLVEDAKPDARLQPLTLPAPPEHLRFRDAGDRAGARLGNYRLERTIASGGMGTVYLATRADAQFEKRVAIKLIKRGMDTEDILRRFRNERQVLADLDHAGIARLLDGGATDDGLPYLVMEFVEGVAIDRFCDARSLSIERRLELFCRVCDAVQYAHDRGVVHRDLKPSNVLVTADARPKLLDFGIAKVVNTAASSQTIAVTATEFRLMTPEYASPEQVKGGIIGPASDVYSLGVILYELLTGHRPYRTTTQLRGDLERVICHEDPEKPSAVVDRPVEREKSDEGVIEVVRPEVLSARRASDTERLRRQLAGDLDTIVLTALRKEPERRYPSAAALADDVRRALSSQPVLARRDTWSYRTSKFARRHKGLVAAALAVFVALSTGLFVAGGAYVQAADALAESERREYVSRIAAASAALDSFNTPEAREHLEKAPQHLRNFEWRHLARRVDRSDATLVGVPQDVRCVAFDPRGDTLAAMASNGTLTFWDPARRVESMQIGGFASTANSMSWKPDGSQLALAIEGHEIALVDARSFEVGHRWPAHSGGARVVAYSPDGRLIASGGFDNLVRVWDSETLSERAMLAGHSQVAFDLGWRPDQRRIVSASVDGTARLWDIDSRACAAVLEHGARVNAARFSPDGRLVATGAHDGVVRFWDAESGAKLRELGGHTYEIHGLAFSPDGKWLASASWDRTIRVWEVESGACIGVLVGHTEEINTVAFHPDGAHLASGAADDTVRLWRIGPTDAPMLVGHTAWLRGIAISPDGTGIATAGGEFPQADWSVRYWDAATRALRWSAREHTNAVVGIAISPDGRTVASGSLDRKIKLWDAANGDCLKTLTGHGREVPGVAFSPDGSILVSASSDQTWRSWSLPSGEPIGTHRGHDGPLTSIEFSRDGRRVLTGARDRTARVWDVNTGKALVTAGGHDGRVWDARFSPDGALIATASADRTVRIWNATDGSLLHVLRGHTREVWAVAFTPDGSRLASGAEDFTVRIWDPARGEHVTTLRGHDFHVFELAFSPDASFLASGSGDATVRIWDALSSNVLGK